MMTKTDGAWVGWHGAPDETVEPFSHGGMDLVPVQLSTRRHRALLRGLLQRHPLAALPRRHRPAGVPPHLVGRLPQGQPAVRRRRRPPRRPRAPPSGCRTTSSSWSRGCCASRGRTCASGSSTTSRSRRRRSSPSCRGAGRSSTACSAPTWSGFQRTSDAGNFMRSARRFLGASVKQQQVHVKGQDGEATHIARAQAFPISIDVRADQRARPRRRRSSSAPARSARTSATPRPCCSASTGSTTPRASGTGSRRTGSSCATAS